jgi:hypothetical protein
LTADKAASQKKVTSSVQGVRFMHPAARYAHMIFKAIMTKGVVL